MIVEPCLQEADGALLQSPWYIGSECDGGFAQYVRVAARHAYPITSPLTDTELASFPCSYSTAENMLTRANLRAGDRVLVTGASGGVGSATVQLARARGAEVIAQTSAAKVETLMDLGAAQCVDRQDELRAVLGENSVDVVIDLVAGPGWPARSTCCAPLVATPSPGPLPDPWLNWMCARSTGIGPSARTSPPIPRFRGFCVSQ